MRVIGTHYGYRSPFQKHKKLYIVFINDAGLIEFQEAKS